MQLCLCCATQLRRTMWTVIRCWLLLCITYLLVSVSSEPENTALRSSSTEELLKNQLRHPIPNRVPYRSRRAATARLERLWDYGVIPYEIETNFSGTFPSFATSSLVSPLGTLYTFIRILSGNRFTNYAANRGTALRSDFPCLIN